ncbi:MAG TPA: hypothetical protein VFL71_16935 [Actinomycetes bacterium]|nr:hypothetical protein [Actinomycetes bacterium]
MRHVRSALTSFLLAVLVAVAVAGCGRDGAAPAGTGAEPAATPSTAPGAGKRAADARLGPDAAEAAALAFMRELGMRDPTAGSFRATVPPPGRSPSTRAARTAARWSGRPPGWRSTATPTAGS